MVTVQHTGHRINRNRIQLNQSVRHTVSYSQYTVYNAMSVFQRNKFWRNLRILGSLTSTSVQVR